MKKNKFNKALRHLKSTELDEKIQKLDESPTNSIGGVYALNKPGFRLSREKDPAKVFYPDADGNFPSGIPGTPGEPNYVRPAGYWDEGPGTAAANPYDTLFTADWSYSVQEENPRNTDTLIDPDTGYVLSDLPPDSRSFILGPLVDLYFHNHGSDNRTFVGYVQKDTREFVLLGRVDGRWGNDDAGNLISQDGFTTGRIWNGLESSFSASNSNFTFEMLQWFHDKLKAGQYVKRAAFFNSGGTPIVSGSGGEGQPDGTVQGNAVGAGAGDASDNGDAKVGAGIGGDPDIGSPQDDPNHGDPTDAGFPWGLINSFVGAVGGPLGAIGDIVKLLDKLPAFDYSKDIATSILTGEPVVHDESDIPQSDINALVNNIAPSMIGNSIPVTNQEIPYADDNIKTDQNGKVSPNVGPNKVPNTTGPMSYNSPGFAGVLNPLHAAGQAQGQVIVPSDGSPPYFKYTDHAYYNPDSKDKGEVPDPIKSVLANLIQSLGGGLDGYPKQIKGDSIKTFKVPVSELPPNLQSAIQRELDYQNIVKTQKDNQTQSDIKYTNDVEKFFDIGQPERNRTSSQTKSQSTSQTKSQKTDKTKSQSSYQTAATRTGVPRLYQNRSAAWLGGSISSSATSPGGDEFLKNQFRGTTARIPFLKAQGIELNRISNRIAKLGRNPNFDDNQMQQLLDMQDNVREKIKAEIDGSRPNLKPITQVPKTSDNQSELEKNIEASLKQLEIDNEELKGEKLRRNLAFAADLGLDVLTAVTLLSPIPGDEALALSAQAGRAGLKTGVKQVSKKSVQATVKKNVFKNVADDVADDAARATADLLMNKARYGDDALKYVKKLDDAAASGNNDLVRKIIGEIDNLDPLRRFNKAPVPKPSTKPNVGTNPGGAFPRNSPNRPVTGPQGTLRNSYESQGEILTESRKRILREIKQPYKLPEQPKQKYKMNFKGKFTSQNTPDVTASKKSDDIVSAKNAAGQTWRTKDKYWSGYESTERMNVIYDHVGHGQLYWDTIVDENRNKKNMRDREIQEHLNLIDHNRAMKEIIEQQTLDAPKDPLFKKVANRLKTQIDYPDKPSKNGYPDTPPPEMVNGFHPEYGKRYKYDKLDPHSAEAMPPTGNPEIDANVRKARKLKKILGKKG